MIILNNLFRWVIVLGSFVLPQLCFTQLNVMTFQQLEERQSNGPKNVIVFIHTDWCNYCDAMQNTTFKNKEVIEKLNKDFYVVTLNAEGKNDILFAGKTFRYKPTGIKTGIHELAEELGTINGKMSYPTIVILSPQSEIIFQYSGLLKTSELLEVINQK